jgi:hypothetical protein
MGLTMGMEHPVEAALGTDEQPAISQERHDLPRWQGREFRFVASEQDPLTLLVRQAMRHQAVAAFTTIQTLPITRKLPPPALQGREPHAQQSGHLSGPCTGRHGGIEENQGLAAILRGGQYPSSSPQ